MAKAPTKVAFIYLGRTGALGQFSLELVRTAINIPEIAPTFIFSRNNDLAPQMLAMSPCVHAVATYDHPTPLGVLGSFRTARKQILDLLARERPAVAITIMPHVWSPFITPGIKKLGIRYVCVVHDSDMHPGDPSAMVNRLLLMDARQADIVITLSRYVATRLDAARLVPAQQLLPLFHPDLHYTTCLGQRRRDPSVPLRLLFFGRIMRYKGLPLLLDAIEMLEAEGQHVTLGVAGSGDLGAVRHRLEALGAEVINQWLTETELGPLFARYDAMALSHIEASQSGVAAAAYGNLMPVVGMPVGGIIEQIQDGLTGVLARRSTARALADAIHRLAVDPDLYDRICQHLAATAYDRSMDRFVAEIISEALPAV